MVMAFSEEKREDWRGKNLLPNIPACNLCQFNKLMNKHILKQLPVFDLILNSMAICFVVLISLFKYGCILNELYFIDFIFVCSAAFL